MKNYFVKRKGNTTEDYNAALHTNILYKREKEKENRLDTIDKSIKWLQDNANLPVMQPNQNIQSNPTIVNNPTTVVNKVVRETLTSPFYLVGNETTTGSWRIRAELSGNCYIEYYDGTTWNIETEISKTL